MGKRINKYSHLSDASKAEIWSNLEEIDRLPKDGSRAVKVKELCESLGVSQRALYNWREKLKSEFGGKLVDNGMKVKGRSTLIDAEGNVKIQWIKEYTEENDRLEMFESAIKGIAKRIKARPDTPLKTVSLDNQKMTVYSIGDAHLGLFAWARESGEDVTLDKTVQDLYDAVSMLVNKADETEECYIVDVGDFFHSDNAENKTNRSGNALDVDGRYGKILEVGLDLAIRLIEKALEKHRTVRWRSAIGNHNDHSAIMMNVTLKRVFRDNDRVIIHDEPGMFSYHRFGKNLIGITHGHTVKPDKLGNIMSVDCRDEWSFVEHCYWYLGHVHHIQRKEYENCIVETFRTLVGKDAWHSGDGYRSGRDMQAITLDSEFGEVNRATVGLKLIRSLR